MYLLENYDFLEELVKKGQLDNDPFYTDGLALADKPNNPNTVYVFSFHKGHIWAVYVWTKYKNKAFLKFHKQVEALIFKFNMPILRMGKFNDYKNHTKKVGYLDGNPVYEYLRNNNG